MDERNNNKRKSSTEIEEEIAAGYYYYFVYTNETRKTDIPNETLTHLRVDSSVTEIPKGAFERCEELVQIQLPETLTIIGKDAFVGCRRLKSVQFISRNVASSSSSSSSVVEVPSSINNDNEGNDGTIVFPESVKVQIDDAAFSYCHSLRKIIFGSEAGIPTTKRIGKSAFCCNGGLISVELPNGLLVIESNLFWGCMALTTVKIPSSVIKIGNHAFAGCQSLISFELSHGLLEIGERSFQYCDSIETLQIPSTVSSIGNNAFFHCKRLKHIELPPRTLNRIESGMVYECCGLEYIEIPKTVKEIGKLALNGCTSLSHIRIPPNVNNIGQIAVSNCSGLISIELPPPAEEEGIPLFGLLDISGCLSLVNVAASPMPSSSSREQDHQKWKPTADFLQRSKLGSVADDAADLIHKLNHRFDNSPINKLCYYQSYHSSEDAMVQLRSFLREEDDDDDDPLAVSIRTTQVDTFGMTPLHILSLSQIPNLDMLLAVMDAGNPGHMVRSRDLFGSTPTDYLCSNRMPNSTQIIRRLFQTRFEQVLGLDRSWKSDMLQEVDEALSVNWSSSRRREIGRVVRKYERMEILSLMELYLWKVTIIDEASTEQIVDRQRCRIMSSAAIVIPHVLPFLHDLDV
eukprot:scaffold1170_cov122-Cylindrotheca_fusiformis.AAC.9